MDLDHEPKPQVLWVILGFSPSFLTTAIEHPLVAAIARAMIAFGPTAAACACSDSALSRSRVSWHSSVRLLMPAPSQSFHQPAHASPPAKPPATLADTYTADSRVGALWRHDTNLGALAEVRQSTGSPTKRQTAAPQPISAVVRDQSARAAILARRKRFCLGTCRSFGVSRARKDMVGLGFVLACAAESSRWTKECRAL
jgi:hypothetical protein